MVLQSLFFSLISTFNYDGCAIRVNSDLGVPQPLLLTFTYKENFTHELNALIHPDKEDKISLKRLENIYVACPDQNLTINGKDTGRSLLKAKCVKDKIFDINQKYVSFRNITCGTKIKSTARKTGEMCLKYYQEIEIGFLIENKFIRHILVCFNESEHNTLYAYSNLTSSIEGIQLKNKRRRFQTGGFYNIEPHNVNQVYTRNFQRKTINEMLGYPEESTKFITEKGNYFLSRGHLTPRTDFVYGVQQDLTFYYMNAAPQWQTMNGGNWLILEDNCRQFATKRKLDLQIYTGTFGIATLPDITGKMQELYLHVYGKERGLPVPKYYWKVVYEPVTKAGVAFISVNNPYHNISKYDVFCEDICDLIKWVTWKKNDLHLGYSFCCTVTDFRTSVKTLPFLHISKLLT